MSPVAGPARVVTAVDIRITQIQAAAAAVLVSVAVACWVPILSPANANDGKAAVAGALFSIGQHRCTRNDGLRAIEAYPGRPLDYAFICKDGAIFNDAVVRVER